jgi:hypothetical protein
MSSIGKRALQLHNSALASFVTLLLYGRGDNYLTRQEVWGCKKFSGSAVKLQKIRKA